MTGRDDALFPIQKSLTARRKEAQKARVELAVYLRYVGDEANSAQVRRLCWAVAHIAKCFQNEGVKVTSKTTLGDLMREMGMGEINV